MDKSINPSEKTTVGKPFDERLKDLRTVTEPRFETEPQGAVATGLHVNIRPGSAPVLPRGTWIGRFQIRDVLGTGSYGIVYSAFDPQLNREVALKLPIRSEMTTEQLKAYLHGAQAAANIHHQHICPVYEVGNHEDRPYIVMLLVAGPTLAKVLDQRRTVRKNPFSAQVAAAIVRKLALGVAAAHDKKVTHRDLKPANVLVDDANQNVLITDFGLALFAEDTLTSRDAFLGTPAYISPEQAHGDVNSIGPQCDIHALGMMLYELATLTRPFPSTNLTVLLEQVKTDIPKPPSAIRPELDPTFDAICLKALAKDPKERHASAKVFVGELGAYLKKVASASSSSLSGTSTFSIPAILKTPQIREAGEVVQFPLPGGLAMPFCWIPPGTAQLGSSKAEQDGVAAQLGKREDWMDAESEVRRGVFHTKGFWLAKYPVTQEEWHALMGDSPSHFQAGSGGAKSVQNLNTTRFPVEHVSWDAIREEGGFLERLNAIGETEKVFGHAGKFELPHEDMWEYACRGGLGNKQAFYWGAELTGIQANSDGNYPFGTTATGPYLERPTSVGAYEKKVPHPWGLCDLTGNVWEWCENLYEHTKDRVLRGGAWYYFPRYCRSAYRLKHAPAHRDIFAGFRICLSRTS